jgi:para-nitrobenzyl esterase
LQKMEWAKLYAAGAAASRKINPPATPTLVFGPDFTGTPRVGWGPVLDGRIVTMKSFTEGAPEVSKNVPMLIGSVSEENNSMRSRPTEAQWQANLARVIGDARAAAYIAAAKKAHPEKSIRTLSYGVGGITARTNSVRMATLKHNLKAAPVYQYYFCWQSPMLEDAGAWHTAELAFCFDNTKRCEQATGNTPEAQALATKMANAWANFARTGNPSQPGLTWAPFEPTKCPTMVFDNQCRMVDDPEGELRKMLL